jgi:hypothetical protein
MLDLLPHQPGRLLHTVTPSVGHTADDFYWMPVWMPRAVTQALRRQLAEQGPPPGRTAGEWQLSAHLVAVYGF